MARINNFIAEYKESVRSTGIQTGKGLPSKNVVRKFLMIFRNIDDSRMQGMIEYPLEEIIRYRGQNPRPQSSKF